MKTREDFINELAEVTGANCENPILAELRFTRVESDSFSYARDGGGTGKGVDDLIETVEPIALKNTRHGPDKYAEVKKKFKDGDWVFGIGEHVGCSQVFTGYGHFQPFSYLDATDPNDFRLATITEKNQAMIDRLFLTDEEICED